MKSLLIRIENSGSTRNYWTNKILQSSEIEITPYSLTLCEVNVDNIESQTDLNDRVGVAAFSALQAGFQTFIIYVQYGHKQRRKTLYYWNDRNWFW
jgi:hypothetical protein